MISRKSHEHLNEISIQQNFSFDSSMRIDYRNRTDNIIVFFFSLVLLILIFITTLFGERHFLKTNYNFVFLPNSKTESKSIHINGLNCYNLFISLSITLFRNFPLMSNNSESDLISVNQNKIFLLTTVKTQNYLIYNYSSKLVFSFKKHSQEKSDTKVIFFDKNVYRSSYFFHISLNGNLTNFYSGCQLTLINGKRSLTYVLITIRSCFWIVSFILILLFTSKTNKNSNVEQKFTIILIILAFLSDFPMAGIHTGPNKVFILIIYQILSSLFSVFSRFYIIILFNQVRMQKKQISSFEYLIIFALFVFLTIVDSISTFSYEIDIQRFILVNRKMTKIFVEITCDTAVLILVAQTALSIDETEAFRFIFYFEHSILMIFVAGTSALIRCFNVSIDVKTTMEMMEFAALNVFMIVMSYAHWPCILDSNRKYNSSTEESQQKIIIDDETEET